MERRRRDPDSWRIDIESGDNLVELPVDCTGDDVAAALASLGCRQISPWAQQDTRMWVTAIEPTEQAL